MRRFVVPLLAVAAFLCATLPVPAQPLVIYGYTSEVQADDAFDFDSRFDSADGPLDLTAEVPGVGVAQATSFVDFGVNKVSSRLETFDPLAPLEIGVSHAAAIWIDEVTISSPGLEGTRGTFSATLRVEGSGDVTASESWVTSSEVEIEVFWDAFIFALSGDGTGIDDFAFAGWAGLWSKPLEGTVLGYEGDPLNAVQQEVSISFIYGEPFLLGAALDTSILVDNFTLVPGTISAQIDLSNSAYWGGVTALRDSEGSLVTNAFLTSDSGINWFQPFATGAASPEPASALLALLGLAGLQPVRRKLTLLRSR